MIKFIYSLLFVLAVSAMKRAPEGLDETQSRNKRQKTEGKTVEDKPEDSPLQDLPFDFIYSHLVPELTPSSLLLLSLTCKANHRQFNEISRKKCSDEIEVLHQELKEAAIETPRFESLRRVFTKSWPKSGDCAIRLKQMTALNGVLCSAAGIPLLAPTSYSFPKEDMIEYPSCGPCQLQILESKIFQKISLKADLVSKFPLELLEQYQEDDDYFSFSWASFGEFDKIAKQPDLLKKLAGSKMLKSVIPHQYILEEPLFRDLLSNGLDNLDFENNPDYRLMNDEDKAYFEDDQPPVIAAIEAANEDNKDKLLKILDMLDGTNSHGLTKILCSTPKLDDQEVLNILYRDDKLDIPLTFAMMIDNSRIPKLEWLSFFWGKDQMYAILISYSPLSNTYLAEIEVDSELADVAILVALICRFNDEALLALIRQSKSNCSIGLFFVLLKFGRSQEFIKRVLELHEPLVWKKFYWQNIPKNVNIPPSLLPHVIARLKRPEKLNVVIPDKRRFIAAVAACQSGNLWTEEFTLRSLITSQLMSGRSYIIQALLVIASRNDWLTFAVEPIFGVEDYGRRDLQRLLVSEYLVNIQTDKLFEAIGHNIDHLSANMFEHSKEPGIHRSMLPLIFQVLMNRFDGFKFLMKRQEYRPFCLAAVKNTWSNMFPAEASPFEDNASTEVLSNSIKKLANYISYGQQTKVSMMAFYVAFILVSNDMILPEEIRETRLVKRLLQFAASLLSDL